MNNAHNNLFYKNVCGDFQSNIAQLHKYGAKLHWKYKLWKMINVSNIGEKYQWQKLQLKIKINKKK